MDDGANLNGSSKWCTDSSGTTYIDDSRLREGVWLNIVSRNHEGSSTWQVYRGYHLESERMTIQNPISQVYYDYSDARAFVEKWICNRSECDDAGSTHCKPSKKREVRFT